MRSVPEAEAKVIKDLRSKAYILNGQVILNGVDIEPGQRVVCNGTVVFYPNGRESWQSITSIWLETDEDRPLDIAAVYSSEHGEQL